MKAMEQPFKPYRFPALIEPISSNGPMHGQRVRLIHSKGWFEALTWVMIPTTDNSQVCAAEVTVLELPGESPHFLLMHLQPNHAIPKLTLLPDSICPMPGVAKQVKTLVAEISCEPLREMVTRALLHPGAVMGYWRSPASLSDHHNFPGGLAIHSLEVATMVATSSLLSQEDRDLGVALALLHDYGKIWCYRDGKYVASHKRGHEIEGLEKLTSHLENLRRETPDIGNKMREMLSGSYHCKDRRYPLAIGRIVNAFDQMSCEMTRRVEEENWEDAAF